MLKKDAPWLQGLSARQQDKASASLRVEDPRVRLPIVTLEKITTGSRLTIEISGGGFGVRLNDAQKKFLADIKAQYGARFGKNVTAKDEP